MEKSRVNIMVFGTFDGLHPGHLNFFKQAKKLSKKSFLIVSVSRDRNVLKIKGERPFLSEKKRLALVKRCSLVNKAVQGGVRNHIPHITRERPDIIALGYDQKAYVKNLKKDLEKKNKMNKMIKIVRLKPFKAKIYKSHLLKIKR